MTQVYIALGSNKGVPQQHLNNAIEAIQNLSEPGSYLISRWYVSEPIGGPADQPDYLNAVCQIETILQPNKLLTQLQKIEKSEGRVRDVRWGPRTLDLDIIWIENFTSNTSFLTVPHPRAHERAFVLKPLQDLNATFTLQSRTIHELLNDVSEQKIRPL